jgi:cell division protein FtsB
MREYLLLAAGLVALYLVLMLVRLRRQTPETRTAAPAASPPPAQSQRAEPVTMNLELSDSDFAGQLAKSTANLEIQQLRREVTQLRAEVTQLTEEVRQLKATHSVSPIYSEAMSLAERGELPAGIAARCGISIGEAELVAALARREFGTAVADELDDRYK